MYFNDFELDIEVYNQNKLIELLKNRHINNSNHFILTHNNLGFPQVSIFVKENMVVAYYLQENEENFVSKSNMNINYDVVFYENKSGTEILLSKYNIIGLDCLNDLCADFFNFDKLPSTIEWNEL